MYGMARFQILIRALLSRCSSLAVLGSTVVIPSRVDSLEHIEMVDIAMPLIAEVIELVDLVLELATATVDRVSDMAV